ncbi:MAG: efflux RND transporter periplasmic adaptor subunit [Vicinamibacterales bacterium]
MRTTTHTPVDLAGILAADTGSRRAMRWLMWLIVALAIGAATFLVQRSVRNAGTSAASRFITEPATRGHLDVTVSATGHLRPTNTVEVGSELSGLVVSVFVDDNQTVRKGQELARLDTVRLRDQITRSQAALTSAQARLAQAEATVNEASAALERLNEVSRLSGGKVPSRQELSSAEATLARAEADRAGSAASVTEARAALSSDQTNLGKASIRSPINGIVLKRSVEPGQTVAASLQVATLFTIAEDLRKMELEVDVDEADVGQLAQGQLATFTVDAHPNRAYTARVTRVAYGATTTADVVSYSTVLVVDNDDLSLRPGMTASAEISTVSLQDVLLVPNAALRFTPATSAAARPVFSLMPRPPQAAPRQTEATAANDARTVWVLRDGQPVALAVMVGLTDGRRTAITGGPLADGDLVITESAAETSQ